MEQYPDNRTPQQIQLFEKMAEEMSLDRQRDMQNLASSSVLTINMDIQDWERELVDELRRDGFFRGTVVASIPTTTKS